MKICIHHQYTLITVAEITNLLLHQLRPAPKPQFMKIPVYIGYISKNAIFVKRFVILPDVP